VTTLFRPVSLSELSLIWDSGMRAFPPRLPQQPVFYPVANVEYATQIARDWNTKESGFGGYVTRFTVADSYLVNFEPRTVDRLCTSNAGFQPNSFGRSTPRLEA
jgi:hypothetical protein